MSAPLTLNMALKSQPSRTRSNYRLLRLSRAGVQRQGGPPRYDNGELGRPIAECTFQIDLYSPAAAVQHASAEEVLTEVAVQTRNGSITIKLCML